jgi:hypothetical protein
MFKKLVIRKIGEFDINKQESSYNVTDIDKTEIEDLENFLLV